MAKDLRHRSAVRGAPRRWHTWAHDGPDSKRSQLRRCDRSGIENTNFLGARLEHQREPSRPTPSDEKYKRPAEASSEVHFNKGRASAGLSFEHGSDIATELALKLFTQLAAGPEVDFLESRWRRFLRGFH